MSTLKAERVYSEIKTLLSSFAAGQKLPTETELASTLNTSRHTVRAALKLLREEGLVKSTQGSGSFYTGGKKTNRISVITPFISEYIFPSIMRGTEQVLTDNSYAMMLHATNGSISAERKILLSLLENPVDGLIVEGTKSALPNPNEELYYDLARTGVPIVFTNGFYRTLSHPLIKHVVADDFDGGYQCVQFLYHAGCRSIGGIFKIDEHQGHQRYAGFTKALLELGLEYDNNRLLWFTTEAAPKLPQSPPPDYLKLLTQCDGLLCFNDQIFQALIPSIQDSSLKAVASFDGIMQPPAINIPFCSLPHPQEELGRVAARILVNMINGMEETSCTIPWGSI